MQSDQACLSPCLVTDLDYSGSSLTMFSSGAGSPFGDPKKSSHMINNQYPGYKMESPPGYVPSASPLSQAPSSPYSPGLRPMIRFSSTESVRTNSSSSINLKEDLSELAELQQQTAAAQQVIFIFTKEKEKMFPQYVFEKYRVLLVHLGVF